MDSFSSCDADIKLNENELAAIESRRKALDEEIKQASYDDQIRERISSIRHKEDERDKLQAEVKALSQQGESRAKLSFKRSALETKNSQVTAS